MSSLDEYQTAKIIARDIRMRRQVHRGAFVLVEGETDVLRFKKFFSDKVMFVSTFGKPKMLTVVEQFYEDGFEGVVGLVDSDFDRIEGTIKNHEGLCYSSYHDFDMDLICSNALTRYLDEVADKAKLTKIGGGDSVANIVIDLLSPISALRFANQRHSLRYNLQNIKHDDFCDGYSCDIDRLVDHVSSGRFNTAVHKKFLKEKIVESCCLDHSPLQLTSGHDFCAVLGIALRDKLGSRRIPQTLRGEVETHLRLTYDRADFEVSCVKSFCAKWQLENPSYILLN
jgi:hypothetical protein